MRSFLEIYTVEKKKENINLNKTNRTHMMNKTIDKKSPKPGDLFQDLLEPSPSLV